MLLGVEAPHGLNDGDTFVILAFEDVRREQGGMYCCLLILFLSSMLIGLSQC